MNVIDIKVLNKQFGLSSEKAVLTFEIGSGAVPVVKVENEQASALISLQGAHLLSWIPKNEEAVIWLSEDAVFSKGKSVRGGIPVCWPWFGAHNSQQSFPAHGFARTILWNVVSTQQLASGDTQIKFELNVQNCDSAIKKMCPVELVAEYTLNIGEHLKLELVTFNNGKDEFVLGGALHTYFNVENVKDVNVTGLDGVSYLDKPDSFNLKKQQGDIRICEEVNRVYLQTTDDIFIKSKKRKIRISKTGSDTTVVWNPWEQVAKKMGDLGENGYLNMLCVESANAADDVVTIPPGESHSMRVTYHVEK